MNLIGGIDECRKLHAEGKFKEMCDQASMFFSMIPFFIYLYFYQTTGDPKSKEIPLGLKDLCINGVEWLLRGLVNPFGVFGKETEEQKKVAAQVLASAKTLLDSDFDVLRTNWYWRHQKRTVRITQKEMLRIDPDSNVVKETFLLSDITMITLNSDKHLVIQFKNHPAEFYECVNAPEFVKVLLTKCPEPKPKVEKQNCKM